LAHSSCGLLPVHLLENFEKKGKNKKKTKKSYFRAINTIIILSFGKKKEKKEGSLSYVLPTFVMGNFFIWKFIVLVGTFHFGLLIYWYPIGWLMDPRNITHC
jgi:hypothetical protein